jgi:hypothetical protein
VISYKVTSIFIGVVLFLLIMRLVRKGRLQERHSIMWFVLAVLIVVTALFPQIINSAARIFGVHYAPNLLLILGLAVLLIQNLYIYMYSSRHEAMIRELSQQVALLSRLLEEARGKVSNEEKGDEGACEKH